MFDVTGPEGLEEIRRKIPYNPGIKDEAPSRTVYVKGFGEETATTQFEVEAFFAQFGPTNLVRLRRTDDQTFKGSCWVEFQDEQTAQKFLDLDPKPLWQGKHELKIMSFIAYTTEKNGMIRDGEMEPNATRTYRDRGRGGKGNDFKGDRGRRDRGDRDPDDWKKRREDDQKSGFRNNRNGRDNRNRNGRDRGRGIDRHGRNNDRNQERRDRDQYDLPLCHTGSLLTQIIGVIPRLKLIPRLKKMFTIQIPSQKSWRIARSVQGMMILKLKVPQPNG
jgi:lupus La protein